MTKQTPATVTAHTTYKELLKVLELGRLAGVMLGKCLYQLKANKDYQKAVGEGVDTWEDFLKMPEIGLEVREANRAMDIYEQFCVIRGYSTEMVAEAGTKNLHRLLPMIKRDELDDKEIKGLLKDGANLPQKSFKERLHDVRGGDRHYEFVLMRRCIETNNMQRVHDIESPTIIAVFEKAGIFIQDKIMPEVI